jgi:hypothetical protein
VTELWINLTDSESNTIGTGPSTAGGVDATGFFSFFDAGDLVSLKNIEDSGDSVIYRLTAKPQWEYTPAYASYVVLSVDTNSPAITGPTSFASDSTYAIDFTKNGILSGLNCTTDQIIRYDGVNWVCAYQHRGELYTSSWDANGYFANGPPCDNCNSYVGGLFSVTRQISTEDYNQSSYECGRDTFVGQMYPDCNFRLPALGSHGGCTMTLSENSGSLDGSCSGFRCEFDGTKLIAGEPARITVVCPD